MGLPWASTLWNIAIPTKCSPARALGVLLRSSHPGCVGKWISFPKSTYHVGIRCLAVEPSKIEKSNSCQLQLLLHFLSIFLWMKFVRNWNWGKFNFNHSRACCMSYFSKPLHSETENVQKNSFLWKNSMWRPVEPIWSRSLEIFILGPKLAPPVAKKILFLEMQSLMHFWLPPNRVL